jgi:hypothetical protein
MEDEHDFLTYSRESRKKVTTRCLWKLWNREGRWQLKISQNPGVTGDIRNINNRDIHFVQRRLA